MNKKNQNIKKYDLWFFFFVLMAAFIIAVSIQLVIGAIKEMEEIEPVVQTKEILVQVPVKEVEVIEVVTKETVTKTVKFDESTQALLARVVMSESGRCDLDCKLAVLWTIQNRVNSDKYPNTYFEVVTQENQYSITDNGNPTEECYEAVALFIEQVNDNVESFPSNMTLFRSDYFHTYGTPYARIDELYFSCENENESGK